MSRLRTPTHLLRELALVVLRGALILFGGILLWHAALIANAILSPSIPWFVGMAAGGLYLVARYVRRSEFIETRLALRSVNGFALQFGVTATTACLCIAILQGSFAHLQLGPLAAPVHASPLVTNLAVLLLPGYAAVIEELSFRGAIQTSLEKLLGSKVAIAATTLLFLGVHVQKADFASQWMFYLSFSVVLGIVAARYGSLALCVLLHVTVNLVSVAIAWAFGPFQLGNLSEAAQVALTALALAGTASALVVLRGANASSSSTD